MSAARMALLPLVTACQTFVLFGQTDAHPQMGVATLDDHAEGGRLLP